jgi:hypothetical protein
MISFGVYDCLYRDYIFFETEEEAREYIETQTADGIASKKDFRLFRRQNLEIEE